LIRYGTDASTVEKSLKGIVNESKEKWIDIDLSKDLELKTRILIEATKACRKQIPDHVLDKINNVRDLYDFMSVPVYREPGIIQWKVLS
jgi:hypothetical protein